MKGGTGKGKGKRAEVDSPASSPGGAGSRRKRLRVGGGHQDQEDGEIAWLEHALGLDKSEGKSRLRTEFEQDGLEDLFDELEDLEAALDGSDGSSSDDGSVADGRPQELAPESSRQSPVVDRPEVGSEAHEALRRRISGLLNRLSPGSLAQTVVSLADLPRARPDTGLLGTCLVAAVLDHVQQAGAGSDNLLVTYAALAVSVGRGALRDAADATWLVELLRILTRRLDVLANPQATEALLRFLGHLFVLGGIPSTFVMDACRHVLSRPTEQSMACLLATLKVIASDIGRDDRAQVQAIISSIDSGGKPPRFRYLLEASEAAMTQKRRPADAALASATSATRHFLDNSFNTNTINVPPFAALIRRSQKSNETGMARKSSPLASKPLQGHTLTFGRTTDYGSLRRLARDHGMDTELRQKIFALVLTSEDYVDGCERLRALHLNGHQERQIYYVLLRCIATGTVYNPFYTLVVQGLAKGSHSGQTTLRIFLWDLLRHLGAPFKVLAQKSESAASVAAIADADQIGNISQAFGWWLGKACLPASILKPIPWLDLSKETKIFVTQMLSAAFLTLQGAPPSFAPGSSTSANLPASGRLTEWARQVALVPGMLKSLEDFLHQQDVGLAKQLADSISHSDAALK